MYLKSKENKQRINMPVPMGLNQKAGVFFSKQQRTKQLEQQNVSLQEKLDLTLKTFHQQNQYLKQLKTKNNTTENIISVISIENQMLQKQNQQNQNTLEKLQYQRKQLNEKEKVLTAKMIDLQKQLFQNTKKYQQSSNLLQRYQEQIQNQKTLRYAPDSIVNVVTKLEKDLDLLKRNLTIHENKFQGKKKYLDLIQKNYKKQIEQVQKMQKDHQKAIKSPQKTFNIYDKATISNRIINSPRRRLEQINGKQVQKKITKQIQQKKEQTKQFNELTRKKNALMMQKSSKKVF